MLKRHRKKTLFLVVGLTVSAFFFLEFNTVLVLFRSLADWCIGALKLVFWFLHQVFTKVFRSFVSKRIMRPIMSVLGLTWLSTYISRKAKKKVIPKITAFFTKMKEFWRGLPRHLRAGVLLGLVVVSVMLGFGLWLIPFGVPFYTTIAAKVHILWAGSWLQRKTKKFRVKTNRLLFRIRPYPPFNWLRALRYWLIIRDRRFTVWVNHKIQKT